MTSQVKEKRMNLASWLGIEHPVIQAPMAGAQGSALAVAVSNAGALGSLPAAMLAAESLRKELQRIRDGTDRPFNVNFFCHRIPAPDAEREWRWRAVLAPYYREFGMDAASVPAGSGRAAFTDEMAEVIEPFAPPVVSFHFGLPAPELLARVKRWGAKVLSTATTVAEAQWLEANGADAVIAQGLEAGGHRGHFLHADLDLAGQCGTAELLPQVLAAVKLPVIAAGGIADAAGVQAAQSLGAAGVQVGTAFLLCHEATTRPVHRDALKGDERRNTALTNLFTGRPARGIVNRLMRELGAMHPEANVFPLATAAVGPLRMAAEAQGSGDFSPLWAGQNTRGCREVGAAEIVRDLAAAWR
jgi:nitronate monooxygenase